MLTGICLCISACQSQGFAQVADSITIRVFTGFRLNEVTVYRRGSTDTIRMAVREANLLVNNVPQSQPYTFASDSEPVTFAAQNRTRSVLGIFRIQVTNEEIIITARESLREYLASVLATEASSNDPQEYLIALSVLQRNYITAHPHRHLPDYNTDLCDNTHCQRSDYTGVTAKIRYAVDSALHIRLSLGEVYPSYYSVNCGGSTLVPSQVWQGVSTGYSNVNCPYCRNSPNYRWQRSTPVTQTVEAIMRTAAQPPFIDDRFKIRIGRAIGFNIVRSNTVESIARRSGQYVISGRGFGHRIGLCQEGACELARQGKSAIDILHYYFPACTVSLQPF